ncbi:hypothetical protein FAM09_24720 [Niastella caeni]|uniref:Uncharacterized protein n=1 Tax=Niastella caeni TaxID=2569763 RepID=A0A4S8HH11_9BACT|nr:hypothetical protein [Niastella caeni]THU34225.1 hypothetical protein FAM09_24720 [Niastella caeni]
MPLLRKYEQWQKDFIKENAGSMTLKQLSEKLNMPIGTIHAYCKDNNILTRKAHKRLVEIDKPKQKIVRPPAIYSQSGSPYGIANLTIGVSLISNSNIQ